MTTTTHTNDETFTERHAGHICAILIAVAAAVYGVTVGAGILHGFNAVTAAVVR